MNSERGKEDGCKEVSVRWVGGWEGEWEGGRREGGGSGRKAKEVAMDEGQAVFKQFAMRREER